MIFIDSEVATDDGMGVVVGELFIWIVEEGDVVLVCSVIAGDALAAVVGRTRSGRGRVTPGRESGGRPAEHNTIIRGE